MGPASGAVAELAERIVEARARRSPLRLVGGDTKAWYGRPTRGDVLDVSAHRGVVAYEPTEMVITARGGTPAAEIEATLAEHGQRLAFEPPLFGPASTIGGVVAAGLAGPARPFTGAVRDFVLGATVLDGAGRVLRFGGTVFKNVAGFDAFRLQAGALGRLGVILEVSLRVSPAPAASRALALEIDWPAARALLATLTARALPLSGACHDGERLHLRLAGPPAGVEAAARRIGGEAAPLGFWDEVRHFRHPALAVPRLWRLSLPLAADPAPLGGAWFRDWAGAQAWLATDAPPERVRAVADRAGGYATLFRGARPGEAVFAPLAPEVAALHRRLAAAFDPGGVLNPGRMFEGL